MTSVTDRRGLVKRMRYDVLGRMVFAGYGGNTTDDAEYESSETFAWDQSNRLTAIHDTVSGDLTRTYDALDHVLSETTDGGEVNYTYDLAGRRTSTTMRR